MLENNTSALANMTDLKSDISIENVHKSLDNFTPEYHVMIDNIQKMLPSVNATSSNFYKTYSQYQNVTINVTDLTPLSSIRHLLARIEQKKSAIAENQIGRKKEEIKLRKKQKELESIEDEFDRETALLEIVEIANGLETGGNYIKAAIRELSFLMTQYEMILKKIGKDHLTEEDFENDEKRNHVMTAMKQALNSARPRGGVIDEGNSIYLFDIGINVAAAQREVMRYLNMENDLMSQGIMPTHDMTMAWLESMADMFGENGTKWAEFRGFSVLDRKSLIEPERVPLLSSSESSEETTETVENK